MNEMKANSVHQMPVEHNRDVFFVIFTIKCFFFLQQLAALEETLKGDHNHSLSKNFRIPQHLNGRKVLASFPVSHTARGECFIYYIY